MEPARVPRWIGRGSGLLRRLAGFVIASLIVAAIPGPAMAEGTFQPQLVTDFGGFRNVLPPGENGTVNAAELAFYLLTKDRPAHSDDQNAMYRDLLYAAPGLTAAQIPGFFKDASFGVPAGHLARQYMPRADVVVQRDTDFGVAHIYGLTRGGAEFGAGYVAAEDRLFLMDGLRNLGRGRLTTFLDGLSFAESLDQAIFAQAPYTESDLRAQYDRLPLLYGLEGSILQGDVKAYVAGVNAYIQAALVQRSLMPVEYALLGRSGPEPWTVTDVVATAAVVGAEFGGGGGGQLQMGMLLQGLRARFGSAAGLDRWRDFRALNDPEAPTTVHNGLAFPYLLPPAQPLPQSVALPDPGSVTFESVVAASSGAAPAPGDLTSLAQAFRPHMSNAMLVSAGLSEDGKPIAVMGPQTGYFAPQLLMEEDIHGPGIDARGAAFAGINMYVELGHGVDYAWSATSAGQDITDTFAVRLCDPSGGQPNLASNFYLYRGSCLPMDIVEQTNTWGSSVLNPQAGSQTLRVFRTKLGLVFARATMGSGPVAYTSLRSTYLHEVDSARGFAAFNDPAVVSGPQGFQFAASKVGFAFNWFYTDSRHIAYFNSGSNPVRFPGTDPSLPISGDFPWVGFNPDTNVAVYTPFAAHPQVVDQDFLTSWNNKQAPLYGASDTAEYTSVYRSQLLDERIRALTAGGRRVTESALASAMEDAATVDLRADQALPWVLALIGTPSDPALAAAVTTLKGWVASGSHRIDRTQSGAYDNGDAIAVLDAWWPLLVRAIFEPSLGPALYGQLTSDLAIDDPPHSHVGSAYQSTFAGYVAKDLRKLLGAPVLGPLSTTYCGAGSLAACRVALETTLQQALDIPRAGLYQDPGCVAGDQECYDQIRPIPISAIGQPAMPWFNRPTFQQLVEVQGHRP